MNNFHPGEQVHCYLSSCASSSGGIVTPTPVYFDYWWPTSTDRTRLTTAAGGITTGDSSGEYYATLTPTTSQIGLWAYRWSSTGSNPLTQWGSFRVLDPPRST